MRKIKLVVVSLFDGLSGARVALSRVPKLEVLRYYSSEVDKYAIQIANKNFPQDESYRLGDVTKIDGHKLLKEIRDEFGNDVKILLIGGSPCQGFSMAGRRKGASTLDGVKVTELAQYLQLKKDGFEFDGQSYLFWEYKRIQNEIKPDWFLLENVRVSKEWLPMFNYAMETKELFINSEVVSAQSRPRFYWSNLQVNRIQDKHIFLKDILLPMKKVHDVFKISPNLINNVLNHPRGRGKFFTKDDNKIGTIIASYFKRLKDSVYIYQDETTTATATQTERNQHIKVLIEKGVYRLLTPLECERLQTLPDNYTDGVSNSQRYRMIGNGFTIDVVVEFLNAIVENKTKMVQGAFDFGSVA